MRDIDHTDLFASLRSRLAAAEEREATLRALLDERTALLRECEAERQSHFRSVAAEGGPDDTTNDLSRRIAATLKETTCDS